MHRYSMAYLTANGADPVSAIEMAVAAGYDMLSFRLLPAGPGDTPPPLLNDERLFAQTLSALKSHAIDVADVEMIRIGPNIDIESFKPFLERAARLNARHVLTAVDDTERSRAVDSYGKVCEAVGSFGMTADLEFMPWTACKTIRDALDFISAVDHAASAILFDSLHFDRSASALEDIDLIPRDKMNYIQLCDGPAKYDTSDAGLIWLARNARLFPGRGNIDFKAILERMPAEIAISVEVPDRPLATEMGREPFARAVLEETKRICGDLY